MDIDAVYTWVNHKDVEWQVMHDEAVARRGKVNNEHRSVDDPARTTNRNELFYSIRSIQRYAEWIRNIYVISNCTQPEWSKLIGNLIFVRHEDVFPGPEYLPTFNSHAIETVLHKICGLSENFLYFNDDVFLCRKMNPEDFFWGQGCIYFFPSEHDIPYTQSEEAMRPIDMGAINSANLLIRDFNYRPPKKLHHTPHPLSRSLLEEVECRYRKVVESTRGHAFRHTDDVAMATTLHAYYAKCVGKGIAKTISARYVDIGNPLFLLLVHPWSPLMQGKYSTLCLNEVTSMKFFGSLRDRVVQGVMSKLFGCTPTGQ